MAQPPPEEVSSQPTLSATEPPTASADELAPGTRFADYRILGRLGRGGMGTVYRVRHCTLDRLSALKVLGEGTGGGPRFLREARSAARLDHHNIVSVRHAGEVAGRFFLEMELVEGRSLGQMLAGGPLEPTLATRLVEQVAHALQHAHGRGIVHRDIKPDNVLVSSDGVAKVTDFGLARPALVESQLTAPGSLLGTPAYMAPEQWQGTPADARTDLYALGATYFHLLTGRPPFGGRLADLLRQHTESPAPLAHEVNPAVPRAMSAIVARLMAKKPEERYQSAAELVGDLRRVQNPPADPPAQSLPSGEAPARAARQAQPGDAALPLQPRRLPLLVTAALLWVGVVGLSAGADQVGLWTSLEQRRQDAAMVGRSHRGPRFGGLQLLVADEAFAQRFGMPFDRAALADLLDGLHRAGTRAIALDLLVADRGPGEGDAALAESTASIPGVIHAMDLQWGAWHQAPAPALPERLSLGVSGEGLPRANRATLPLPELLQASRQVGTVGVLVDRADGVVRRVPLLTSYRGRVYPSLSLLAACAWLGAAPQQVEWRPGGPLVISPPGRAPLQIPVEDGAVLRLSVRGQLEDRRPVSLLRAMELARSARPADQAELRRLVGGKLVLVGAAVAGQSDVQPLPGLPTPPLVLAHAIAIETMLGADFVRCAGWPPRLLLIGLLSLLGIAAGLALRSWLAAPLLAFLALAFLWSGGQVLERSGLFLPTVAPLLALLGGGLAGILQRAAVAQLHRRRLLDALGRYLPRRVAQQVIADPRALRLGGQRKELTLLSVELRGFAALSERLEPEEVGELLAGLFGVVAARVQEQEGTIDRFSDEGVRAFFGDPVPLPDHAARAVACALAIRDDALRVLAGWASGGRPRPVLGVGVHTGYVTVGNIGTLQRMEYTVLGRNLEVARRLAGAGRDAVLVSGRTRAAAGDGFLFERRAGPVEEAELEVYEACARR